jgi:hypothetical protein
MTSNRNDSFVPLAPASSRPAGERREFRATVISQSSQTQSFQSVAAVAMTSVASPVAHAAHGEPKVSLQRDGNRVIGIHIQCACGQVMELSCVYDAAPQVAAPTQAEENPGRRDAGGPRAATIPQPAPEKSEPGKKCKDSGKDLPSSTPKKAKTTEKASGTSAAKRRSA